MESDIAAHSKTNCECLCLAKIDGSIRLAPLAPSETHSSLRLEPLEEERSQQSATITSHGYTRPMRRTFSLLPPSPTVPGSTYLWQAWSLLQLFVTCRAEVLTACITVRDEEIEKEILREREKQREREREKRSIIRSMISSQAVRFSASTSSL